MHVNRLRAKPIPILIAIAFAASSHISRAEESITDFGFNSIPFGISADGSIVVGSNNDYGFIWDSDHSFYLTSSPNPAISSIYRSDISAIAADSNGISTGVVGWLQQTQSSPKQAFIWTISASARLITLESLNDYKDSAATGISRRGDYIAGWSTYANDREHAVYWQNTGSGYPLGSGTLQYSIVDIGTLNNGRNSRANAIAADSLTIVGNSNDGAANNQQVAFRWTPDTGMVSLGTLNNGNYSNAWAISYDGNVVVGEANDGNAQNASRAFRWSADTGMVSLGVLPGDNSSYAYGVSGDGKVVVGTSYKDNGTERGFRWASGTGMQTVEQWLTSAGVNVSSSVSVANAKATNSDGSVVVGVLSNGHGYIARVVNNSGGNTDPDSGSGMIDTTNYNTSLLSVSHVATLANQQTDQVLHGAHSSPMRGLLEPGKNSFWVAGDIGRQDHNDNSGNSDAGEIGFARGFANGTMLKMALGRTYSDTSSMLNGKTTLRGTYILPEVIFRLPDTPLFATLSAYYNTGDADIRRGYSNSGINVTSAGSADVTETALRARLDWLDAFTLRNTRFTPYTSLSYARSHVDGYTEHGGGFAARWDKRNDYSTQVRLGLDAVYRLNERFNLLGRIEAVHRMEDQASKSSGQIIGLSNFDLPGINYKQQWGRASVGAEGAIGSGTAALTLSGTTEASTPSVWLYGSYRWVF
ncbi:putative HAF family extracellular repeat protein [Methylovorus glucosotrophus]|uniref:autotransporter domain-containing protein n=1 Tax=Methylovorus glucosotrophus TaxID=266009 RepID=UPI001331A177|nr:autotransporter domain-containing protein [Methylovorus glucosotrophus]KAF0844147.1 putative HAF family extracellular repeat protein [Methylovorus glucosotrophus]